MTTIDEYEAERIARETREFLNRIPEHLYEDVRSIDQDTQGLCSAMYFDDEPIQSRTHQKAGDRDTQGLCSAMYFDDEPIQSRTHQKAGDRDTQGLCSAMYFDDEEVQ